MGELTYFHYQVTHVSRDGETFSFDVTDYQSPVTQDGSIISVNTSDRVVIINLLPGEKIDVRRVR